MRTRHGETFDWGYGFALPRLLSRPQEGSGEECGRGSELPKNFLNRQYQTEMIGKSAISSVPL